MWRSERTSARSALNHSRRGLSWVGGIVGLLLIFVGLALEGIYANWFTSWAAANLPYSISGIVLIIVGVAVLVCA
ncbi:MAG: hypothetical protein WA549_06300 [Thermoplasmata archaeon]